MNPGKMRSTYGKMMFMLQDTETRVVKAETKLSFVRGIVTVSAFLKERHCVALLEDPLLETATASIDDDAGYSRAELAARAEEKRAAIALLSQSYSSGAYVCV